MRTKYSRVEGKQVMIIIMMLVMGPLFGWVNQAQGGPGLGMDASGNLGVVKTYYANSPSGPRTDPTDPTGVATIDTGTALQKFVDGLPLLGTNGAPLLGTTGKTPGLNSAAAGTQGVSIPVAVADTTSYPGSDYYEIAVVEYAQWMHSNLPKATRLRGYVQLATAVVAGSIPLYYPDGTTAIKNLSGAQVYAVANPTYLGPVIVATKGRPVRIKYSNYLPKGSAGELFIPVDETLMGAGLGPDGTNKYTSNRTIIHLHGGNTPWISDGTPHQWTVPVGESTTFMVGDSFKNVPDMPDPGQGAQTLYYTNDQSARLMFYHDHAVGITRLNVYAGMAAGYLLNDAAGVGENYPTLAAVLPTTQIPLIIQDKTFVPKDVVGSAVGATGKGQDEKWNVDTAGNPVTKWGVYGDLWFPHVYETNQDPQGVFSAGNLVDGTNPVGRWDWGPWFWPVFPSMFDLPTGEYGAVTTTPESFEDTPVINGMAYPVLNVEPKSYRFRILAAGNDRFWNLGLYQADTGGGGTGATATALIFGGSLDEIAVTAPGSGYTSAPGVYFTGGGGGSGAAAEVQLQPTTVAKVTVHTGGSGYTSAPMVNFVGGNPLTTATATAIMGPDPTDATKLTVIRIDIVSAGTGYTSAPYIQFLGGGGDGARATTELTPTGVAGITLTQFGAGYTTVPTITIGSSAEVKMVSFTPLGRVFPATGGIMGTGWGSPDSMLHPLGVPDPNTVGPNIIQIGSEGGLMPVVRVIPSTPVNFEYNKRSITVLNVLERGLYLGPAERADAVIDFSQFAGKTLILYNDAPAPVPAADPRIDYATNGQDYYQVGGPEPTKPGYGPNTRTIMQIAVSPTLTGGGAPPAAFDPSGTGGSLAAVLPPAYATTQDQPIVAQAVYNTAFGTANADNYAKIYTGSYLQPSFKFTSSTSQGLTGVSVTPTGASGAGYTSAPTITFSGGGGMGAGAIAVMNYFAAIKVTAGGSGYTSVPTVTIAAPPRGTGNTTATATATLGVASVTVNANNRYATGTPTVTFSTPAAGGVQATGTAVMTGVGVTRRVGSVTITNAGSGYPTLPTVTFSAPPAGGVQATGTVSALVGSVAIASPGSGYTTAPAITFTGGGGTGATAIATGNVKSVTLTSPGFGYTSVPTVAFTGGGATTGAVGTVNGLSALNAPNGVGIPVMNKAIQELFEPEYGRMNATLGVELPFTSALTQTTIPLNYVDPATEEIANSETQLWKITHNGVDTHPVHFHLWNVQVVNRVGWDGTVKPPYWGEEGWKETVKMSPLEDVVVAIKAKTPPLPGFGLPRSSRAMSPSTALGTTTGITQIDPMTNNPLTITNAVVDYDNEYVWHCHILGHEENDFMRPVIFHPNAVVPAEPTNVVAVNNNAGGTSVNVSWTDNASTEYQYQIDRYTGTATLATTTGWTTLGTALANAGASWTIPAGQVGAGTPGYAPAGTFTDNTTSPSTNYTYRVSAVGASGTGAAIATITTNGAPAAPAAPSNLQVAISRYGTSNNLDQAVITWTNNAGTVTGFTVQRATNANFNGATSFNVAATATSLTQFVSRTAVNGAQPTYYYQIRARNNVGNSAWAVTTPAGTVAP